MGIYLRIKFIIQISAIKLGRQKDSKSVAKITKIRVVLLPIEILIRQRFYSYWIIVVRHSNLVLYKDTDLDEDENWEKEINKLLILQQLSAVVVVDGAVKLNLWIHEREGNP